MREHLVRQDKEEVTSYFAEVRANMEGDDVEAYLKQEENPTKKGSNVIKTLLKNFDENYVKKFPFERGQFQQCIPNPRKEDEFITLQIVNRQNLSKDANMNYEDLHMLQQNMYLAMDDENQVGKQQDDKPKIGTFKSVRDEIVDM
jgi:hypothetical protein